MTEKEYKIAQSLIQEINTYDRPQLYLEEQKNVVEKALLNLISEYEDELRGR